MTSERAGPLAQVPLLTGVVSHRKLATEQIDFLRVVTRQYLGSLRAQFPDAPLLLASTLSSGAGLLAVDEALALGLDCCAVLPCALADNRKQFDRPLKAKYSTDIVDGKTPRDRQFLAACRLIAADAFIVPALLDSNQDSSATS